MKKLFLLLTAVGVTTFSFGQGVWTGTTTTSKVGIGTTTPDASLTIKSALSTAIGGGVDGMAFKIENFSGIGGDEANVFELYDKPAVMGGGPPPGYTLRYWISNKGSVGLTNSLTVGNTVRIGPKAASGIYAGYRLSVDGDMIAKRCVIQVDSWADYVFDKDYNLPALRDLETYVATNKHLPGVPSEAEVKEKGVEVGAMNKILMQKVEELTLYIIALKKEVDQLKTKN